MITVPILIMQSTQDKITPPENAEIIYQSVSSSDKKIVWLHNSDHCAPLDYDKEIIAQAVTSFVRERT